jgi:hypothetical protein
MPQPMDMVVSNVWQILETESGRFLGFIIAWSWCIATVRNFLKKNCQFTVGSFLNPETHQFLMVCEITGTGGSLMLK